MSRRSEILDEMGLTPRWTLRQPPRAEADVRPPLPPGSGSSAAPLTRVVPDRLMADPPPAPPASPASQVQALALALAQTQAQAQALPPDRDAAARSAGVMQMDWPQLADTVAGCTACSLAASRKCTVFGVGDRRGSWLFVGEGPGADEDECGEPFVGQAGRLLDNMLAALQMKRGEDVYVANIVKCRPPGNRVPAAAEVAACEPYLHRQIELIQPKLILALGKTAAVTLLGKEQSIASMRGKVFRYRETPLIVTYHPAYLLRSLPDKIKAWEDLCFARARVREWTLGAGPGMGDAPAGLPPG